MDNKNIIKMSIIISISIFIIATVAILVICYNTDGEKNLPFSITNIRVASTIVGNETTDKFKSNIIQKNDFYFYIEKNSNYTKEDSISKITFENFNFDKKSDKGVINIYIPSTTSNLYTYSDEYKVENELSYTGSLSTNLPSLEISNQGGLIGFSIAISNLGTYGAEEVLYDGTLLSKLGLTMDDIFMKVSFDVIIETSSHNKFKTTLTYDLPTGNIIEEGMCMLEQTDLNDIVFKRF